MSVTAPLISALCSAAMLALALPNEFSPYGIPILGFVCLAPYFAALGKTASRKEAALTGAVFGAASHAFSSYWLFFFQDFAFWTIGATSIAYACLHAVIAPLLRELSLPWSALAPWKRKTGENRLTEADGNLPDPLRPVVLAAAWTVWEWQKSVGFLGYPWGTLPISVNDAPLLTQIVDSTGVYGLSFLLALSNAALAELGRLRRPLARSAAVVLRPAALALVVLAWYVAYGAWRIARPTPVIDAVPMVLVQHNGDSWVSGGELKSLKRLIELTREGIASLREGNAVNAEGEAFDRPALVAWSETVLSRPFADYKPYFRRNPKGDPLIPFLAEIDTPLLTGAPIVLNWDTYEATNSAILIESDSSVAYSYAKRHPVPFAEAIPFWEFQWMRKFIQEVVGLESGWTMGTEATVMEIPTSSGRPLRFGVPICFEDAFADVCADFFRGGADFLLNITNDSWSRTVSSETQHLAVARFRAIENRRVLVRATNGGVTAVVDAEGRMIASLPLFTEAALAVIVPIQAPAEATTYFLLGDWLPLLFSVLLIALIAMRFRVASPRSNHETTKSRSTTKSHFPSLFS